MNLKSYEEVIGILKNGNYMDALAAYSELINEARRYIMDVATLEDPDVLLQLIEKQKIVLSKMEIMYNEVFPASQVIEDGLEEKLSQLYESLTDYEQFITNHKLNTENPVSETKVSNSSEEDSSDGNNK